MNRMRKTEYLRRRTERGRLLAALLCLFVLANVLSTALPPAYASETGARVETVHKTLICTLPEGEGHQHTEACYAQVRGDLTCPYTDPGHIHTDDCYEWKTILVCGLEEGEGAHRHTDKCYRIDTAPITRIENEGETFAVLDPDEPVPEQAAQGGAKTTASPEPQDVSAGVEADPETAAPKQTYVPVIQTPTVPLTGSSVPVGFRLPENYGMPDPSWLAALEKTEAQIPHGPTSVLPEEYLLVFAETSDPTADLEDEEVWDAMFADFKLTGNWAKDLVAVAESQLGYTESTENYAIAYDNSIKGYTRYGAWYGIPYGDWCAMFVSFCLHYANIPWSAFPYSCHTVVWTNELDALHMFHSAKVEEDEMPYIPKPGDLIFYDFDVDGRSDHVGIVSGLNPAAGTIYTIEGNRYGYVEEFEIIFEDYTIFGYGELPVNPHKGAASVTSAYGASGKKPVEEDPAFGPMPASYGRPAGTAAPATTAAPADSAKTETKEVYYPTTTPKPVSQRTYSVESDAAPDAGATPTETDAAAAELCVLEDVIRIKTTEIQPLIEHSIIQTVLG